MNMSEDDKQRALVLLASHNYFISYDKLMQELGLANQRQLEDFLIRSITQEIIKGRLNPHERRLEVSDWSSQKISDDFDVDLEGMEQTLNQWIEHCEGVVKTLNEETEKSSQRLCVEVVREKKIEDESEKVRKFLTMIGVTHKFGREPENFGPFSRYGGNQKNDAKRYKGAGLRSRRN